MHCVTCCLDNIVRNMNDDVCGKVEISLNFARFVK